MTLTGLFLCSFRDFGALKCYERKEMEVDWYRRVKKAK